MQITLHNKNIKRICFILLLLIWALSVMSASTHYTEGDSVGAKQQNGNSYIVYKVSSGETVYAVARKYDVSYATIVSANPGLDMNKVKAGQIILVPSRYQTYAAATSPSSERTTTILHTVTGGETLYSIARKYSISFEQLMELNPELTNYNLQPGQKIHAPAITFVKETETEFNPVTETPDKIVEPEIVANEPVLAPEEKQEGIVEETKNENSQEKTVITEKENATNPVETESETRDIQSSTLPVTDKNKPFSTTFAEYTYRTDLTSSSEKGVATWIDGSNDLSTTNERFYALHNTAPIGSVIKIRNLMNNRTIYAKVIGTLSEDEVKGKVMVKLSAGAAQKLNVLDNRFVVEATFFNEKNTSTSQK
ncbi:MAG: LysM peptidoglycan-binding domain-containing protein [Chitinophagales bacterium]